MYLNIKEIEKITSGAVEVYQHYSNISFMRCTKAQINSRVGKEQFAERCEATAGVVLRFTTDSEILRMRGFVDGIYNSRVYWNVDVLVNGEIAYHKLGNHIEEDHRFNIDLNLGFGYKDVEIYLPTIQRPRVEFIELTDGAVFEKIERERKYIAFGDSITQGYDTYHPQYCYAHRVANAFNAELFDMGIGGETFDVETLDENFPVKPDFITVAYGTNDWSKNTDFNVFTKNAEDYLKKLKTMYDCPMFYISPLWRADKDRDKKVADFELSRNTLMDIARKYGYIIADGYDMMPADPALFWDERLHPNDAGFGVYAENLVKLMKENGI